MAAARDLDCRVGLHIAQSAPQWLEDNVPLSERLIAPHATRVTANELRLYAENGVCFAHSPVVSAQTGSILSSFVACRRRGINIGWQRILRLPIC